MILSVTSMLTLSCQPINAVMVWTASCVISQQEKRNRKPCLEIVVCEKILVHQFKINNKTTGSVKREVECRPLLVPQRTVWRFSVLPLLMERCEFWICEVRTDEPLLGGSCPRRRSRLSRSMRCQTSANPRAEVTTPSLCLGSPGLCSRADHRHLDLKLFGVGEANDFRRTVPLRGGA